MDGADGVQGVGPAAQVVPGFVDAQRALQGGQHGPMAAALHLHEAEPGEDLRRRRAVCEPGCQGQGLLGPLPCLVGVAAVQRGGAAVHARLQQLALLRIDVHGGQRHGQHNGGHTEGHRDAHAGLN